MRARQATGIAAAGRGHYAANRAKSRAAHYCRGQSSSCKHISKTGCFLAPCWRAQPDQHATPGELECAHLRAAAASSLQHADPGLMALIAHSC